MTETINPRDPQLRMERVVDADSLHLLTQRDKSGMLAAHGKVMGAKVALFSTDATIQGGAMGQAGCDVILAAYAFALQEKCPVIGLWHSGGARLTEGVASLDAFGKVFAAMTHASGKIPQISLVLGPAAGGGAYGPALTDIVILGPDGRVFVTGPEVVKSVTGESVDMARLGGPEPHGRRSGVVHVVAEDDDDAYAATRRLASLLGNQGSMTPDLPEVDLAGLLPESSKRAYDVHPLIDGVLDSHDDTQELHPKWAPNIVTTLGRLGGRTVGVIANNPLRLGGCLDSSSAEKAARFVRMCDALGVPLWFSSMSPGSFRASGRNGMALCVVGRNCYTPSRRRWSLALLWLPARHTAAPTSR